MTDGDGGHRHGRALLLYAFASLILTYPLILHLPSRILGDGDAWQFTWNMWWAKEALTGWQWPLHTDLIHHPIGTDLHLHTMVWSSSLATIPLQLVMSRLMLYNLLALASFVLAAWGMFRLARELGFGEAAAVAAGFVFSFNPYHYCHALGHLNLLSYQWLPFFLTAAVRAHRRGWPWRGILAVAGWLAVIGLTDWYYLLFALLASALLLIWQLAGKTPPRRLLRPVAALLLGLTLLLPLLAPALATATRLDEPDVTAKFSPQLETFLLPGPVSTWAEWFAPVQRNWTAGAAEIGTFVSPSLLLLALVGWWHLKARQRVLAAIWLGVFFVLSLGPRLQAGAETLAAPLPFAWLMQVPGLDIMRAPIRFHLMTLLALALLYGAGLERLSGRGKRWWMVAALVGLFALETLSIPLQTTTPELSPFWARLREEEPKGALIDLHYLTQVLHNQTHHGWKVAGRAGMVSRESPETMAFLQTEGLAQMMAENRIFAAHNGWSEALPDDLFSSLPERFRLVAMARIQNREVPLQISAGAPFQLWTEQGPQPAMTASAEITAADGSALIVQITLRRQDLPAAPLRISPPEAVEPYLPAVGSGSGMTLLFYRLMETTDTRDRILQRLSGYGFGWITLPYYGNSHFLEDALGLQPDYSDRWIKAYRLPR